MTSLATCTYQDQLTTPLNFDNIHETLLLTCSISNLFQHSNFEVYFVLHVLFK
jgi:hypothetical protein